MCCVADVGHTTRVSVPLLLGFQRQFLAFRLFAICSCHFTPFSLLFAWFLAFYAYLFAYIRFFHYLCSVKIK